jgi:hypothetical protein
MLTPQTPLNPIQGLVWRRIDDEWSHGGGDYGVRTTISFDPAKENGVVVLTNGENNDLVAAVADLVFEHVDSEWRAPELTVGREWMSWEPPGNALHYDVVRGDLHQLRGGLGDYALATEACIADDHPDTYLQIATQPESGEGHWFLVRRETVSGSETYDSQGPSQSSPRDPGILISGFDCP